MIRRGGWPLYAVLLLGLVVIGAGLGLRNPWPADEPRFVLIAKEMLATGQFLLPHRAGELYSDKPPVFFWALALSLWLTGSIKIAHALPGLVAGLAVLTMIYDLARRLWNRRVATGAALLLLFTLQFALQARGSQIDGFMCLWTTLGLYGLCRHLLLGPAWGWYAAGGLAMGIGVITKGVGFLPLLMLAPYALMQWRGWNHLPVIQQGGLRWLLAPLGLLLGAGLWAGPMLIAVATSNDPAYAAYRDDILIRQTAGRYADPWHHYAPFWYYLTSVIPTLWFPLSVLLLWLAPIWVKRFKRQDARIFLPLTYALLVLLFFSISRGKRGVYILPALPALVLAAAPLLPLLLKRLSVQRTAFVLALGFGLLLCGASLYLGVIAPEQVAKLTRDMRDVDLVTPMGALGLIFVLSALIARPRRGAAGLAAGIAGLWMLYGLWIYPLIDLDRSGRSVIESAMQHVKPEDELALVRWKEQIILHAGRSITHFGYKRGPSEQIADAAAWLRQAPSSRWVLTDDLGVDLCFSKDRAVFVSHDHRRDWYLLNTDSLLENAPAECRLTEPRKTWRSVN